MVWGLVSPFQQASFYGRGKDKPLPTHFLLGDKIENDNDKVVLSIQPLVKRGGEHTCRLLLSVSQIAFACVSHGEGECIPIVMAIDCHCLFY